MELQFLVRNILQFLLFFLQLTTKPHPGLAWKIAKINSRILAHRLRIESADEGKIFEEQIVKEPSNVGGKSIFGWFDSQDTGSFRARRSKGRRTHQWHFELRLAGCVVRFRRKSSSTLVVALEDRVPPGFSDRRLSAEIAVGLAAEHTTDPHDSRSPLKDARADKLPAVRLDRSLLLSLPRHFLILRSSFNQREEWKMSHGPLFRWS